MEFILPDTNIFDADIQTKFKNEVEKIITELNHDLSYVLEIIFNINSLKYIDVTKLDLIIGEKTVLIKSDKDKIGGALSIQLDSLKEILTQYGFQIFSTRIQGDIIAENTVMAKISKDESKPYYVGRGKNKKRMSSSLIAPNMPFTREVTSDIAAKRLSELFYKYMKIVKDKQIVTEVLGIEHTEDINKICAAFAEQYWELWFPDQETNEKLLTKLRERTLEVVRNKQAEKEDI